MKIKTEKNCFMNILTGRFASILTVLIFICCSGTVSAAASKKWVATWGSSPMVYQSFGSAAAPAPLENQTIRQVVRISAGGEELRVRFTNEFGSEPLKIGAASVAILDNGTAIKPATLKKLTFGGKDAVTIPAGAPAFSDPVDLETADLCTLAVSIFFPEKTKVGSVHMGRIAYISSAGDFTNSKKLTDAAKTTTIAFMSGVYVTASKDTGVIVALGDSITDGTASTPYRFNSWPHKLAERFAERNGKSRPMAIVNEGIAGNQLLKDGAGDCILGRFDRDVLATPGLTHIILLIGINDIGMGGMQFPGAEGPAPAMITPEDLIAGYRQLIARAHTISPDVKIYGATLTPFEGTFGGYYSPEKDKIREAVNKWIRTGGEFDAVIDFEKAVRDPQHPSKMAPEYDSGDKLHPGDAGYKKMADSIDLMLFE